MGDQGGGGRGKGGEGEEQEEGGGGGRRREVGRRKIATLSKEQRDVEMALGTAYKSFWCDPIYHTSYMVDDVLCQV